MDPRMVDPLFKDTPDAAVKSGELGGHISGKMNSGVSVAMYQCHMQIGRQCVISSASTLRHRKWIIGMYMYVTRNVVN